MQLLTGHSPGSSRNRPDRRESFTWCVFSRSFCGCVPSSSGVLCVFSAAMFVLFVQRWVATYAGRVCGCGVWGFVVSWVCRFLPLAIWRIGPGRVARVRRCWGFRKRLKALGTVVWSLGPWPCVLSCVVLFGVGGFLLSHNLPVAVPSALAGLASGFGMGPGVSLLL